VWEAGQALRSQAMLEYLKQFNSVLTILLGWFLGLLTPSIAERIRRPYRRRDFMRAVVDEMCGLQYTMAMVAYQVRERRANVSNAFLEEILPILEGYNGPDRSDGQIEAARNSRRLSEKDRAAEYQAMRKPNVGMVLRQYSTPLFAAQMTDLALCELDFQRAVLRIRHHLDLFNQFVPYTQSLFDKTFSNPGPKDREALMANLEEGYRNSGTQAEIIIRAIRDLQERHGSAK
jgi:hypothetical protein